MISGILLLDKPAGLSSNAVLQKVRRLLRIAKAGHVGSLDPLATGMLPICLGQATKVAGEILAGRKLYEFVVRLGARTATGDREGAVIETTAVPALEATQVSDVLATFLGAQQQIPPMFSALKRGGQPLYKLARAGLEVERAARTVEISRLQLLALAPEELQLQVLCSKGTYVRTLAEDIARALGTCGHVELLRRIYVEPFEREAMASWEELCQGQQQGVVPPILPADWPLQHLPAVHLTEDGARRVRQGQVVNGPSLLGKLRLYDAAAGFMGIGEGDGQGSLCARRLFVPEEPACGPD